MAKLNYSMLRSLEEYVADDHGNFDWAAPGEDVHTFVNDPMRPAGTYLYGRRMYESPISGRSFRTSLGYGRGSTRSCSPRRSRRCPAPGRGSNGTSTPKRFGR